MRALVVFAVSTILAASCASPNETRVTMSEYHFDPVDASVPAGDVRFLLVNSGAEPHDLSIAESTGILVGKSDLVDGGGTKVFSLNLRSGRYVVYCSVALHRGKGMEGTLVVR